ncbi:peroxisomal membrane anchor protein conserved region-domain-containing protein [Calycina marina]|uniref:Peroxisomal membrane protein PEX14 n=1 Tax=Calycina marina TaxID=1763456 RepID=A0A9P7ZCG4_9HELO|nr:peroxisomal membrane anchor protein conserved region-domain-containing protein [Calycina marina]
MSDSNPVRKKLALPSWQQELSATTPTEADTDVETPNRVAIIEQAKKFLEQDDVRNEPTDKKIAFLEGKGLDSGEIQTLLGVSRNTEATAPLVEEQAPKSRPAQQPTMQSQPPSNSASSTQTRSTPPIITYPEFLTTPQSPSPLVTKIRLLTTLYLFSGLSAILYGTNTFLVAPMISQLTASRLSLFSGASENLQKLIEKLEPLVSEIPQGWKTMEEDEESEDEDPTEMFHRDIGIQTSPPHTRSTSPVRLTPAPTLEHTNRLNGLSKSLTEALENSSDEGKECTDLSTSISVLREYLDGLAYVAPSFTYGAGGYNYGGNAFTNDDEISRAKANIRAVKGVLLSTRNFPGVRATGR